jgi:uncharacterized protein YjiS (DUF1127 family)
MSRTTPSALKPARHSRRLAISPGWIQRASHLMRLWLTRALQRRELRELELEPAQVKDVGLDPLWVRPEAAKRFWQA